MSMDMYDPWNPWFGRPTPERDENGEICWTQEVADFLIADLCEAFEHEQNPVTPKDVKDMWVCAVDALIHNEHERKIYMNLSDRYAREIADEINDRLGFDDAA